MTVQRPDGLSTRPRWMAASAATNGGPRHLSHSLDHASSLYRSVPMVVETYRPFVSLLCDAGGESDVSVEALIGSKRCRSLPRVHPVALSQSLNLALSRAG